LSREEVRRLGLLVAATAASYPIGLLLGSRWLLPILNTVPAYVLMTGRLRASDRAGALRVTLVWAVALAVCGTLLFTFWPQDPETLVLNGARYRDEMFHWIRTGEGAEGDIRRFLPLHLTHLGAFVALSVATASTVSMVMGAVLMNYMSYYVASLARAGVPAWAVLFLGWQPWAIARVAAFCALGAVLAEPLLSRVRPYTYAGLPSARPIVLAAAAGILADWVLKALLAPHWGVWLHRVLP
jgi:hypothetical protein